MKQERLNSRFLKVLPMSAEESGNGGRNLNIAYSFTETPFGEILMASTSKGICYLAFVTESRDAVLDELKHIFPHAAYLVRKNCTEIAKAECLSCCWLCCGR